MGASLPPHHIMPRYDAAEQPSFQQARLMCRGYTGDEYAKGRKSVPPAGLLLRTTLSSLASVPHTVDNARANDKSLYIGLSCICQAQNGTCFCGLGHSFHAASPSGRPIAQKRDPLGNASGGGRLVCGQTPCAAPGRGLRAGFGRDLVTDPKEGVTRRFRLRQGIQCRLGNRLSRTTSSVDPVPARHQ